MEDMNSIKIVGIKEYARSVRLDLQLGSERGVYDVSILDQDGVFGLELPDELGLKLRNFPPAESRSLIASVKRKMVKNLLPA